MEEQEQKATTTKAKNYTGKLLGDYAPEERRELARMGQAKAVKSRNKRRAARDVLLDILNSDSTNKDLSAALAAKGVEGTELASLLMSMTGRAHKSAQMAELIFRLTGDLQESPQQQITIVNQLSDEQLEIERKRILDSTSDIIDITPEPPGVD